MRTGFTRHIAHATPLSVYAFKAKRCQHIFMRADILKEVLFTLSYRH